MECCMDLALSELHEFTLVSQVSARHAFCFGSRAMDFTHSHRDYMLSNSRSSRQSCGCSCLWSFATNSCCSLFISSPLRSLHLHVHAEVHSRGANPNGLACSCRRAILRWLRQRYDAAPTPFVNSDVIVNIALCCAHSLHTC